MADSYEIDPHLLREFLTESHETLAGLDSLFVSLERQPDDLSVVDQIFRPVHSIKGNSSFFGLTNVKNFSHEMENLLQDIRSGGRVPTKPVIDALLEGFDLLRDMLERISNGDMSTELRPAEITLLEKLSALTEAEGEVLADLSDQATQALQDALNQAGDHPVAALIKTAQEALVRFVAATVPAGNSEANAAASGYFLDDTEVTADITSMTTFIEVVAAATSDTKQVTAFRDSLGALTHLANTTGHATLAEHLAGLADDFETIHTSGIGFDALMQEVLQDKLALICGELTRGVSVSGMFLDGTEVTADMATMTAFIEAVSTATEDAERVRSFRDSITALTQLANATDHAALAEHLAGLTDDFETIHTSGIGFDALMQEVLQDKLALICDELTHEAGEATAAESPPSPASPDDSTKPDTRTTDAPPPNEKAPAKTADAGGKTLRVAEEKVDHFMSFVGELIITGEVFSYIQKKLAKHPDMREISQEFKNANLQFAELSSDLQKSLMDVRRMPVRSVLQKIPRIVRDLSGQLGKEIELHIEGEDVQIDKALLENLESPLVHMVRNSVDHGIEDPATRTANGKAERGQLWVRASADDETFRLEIVDDGGGINLEAIKEKAVQSGVLTAEKADSMSAAEAGRLIFGAGVSTAQTVTDVSGRGVGMDVVLSNISALNGKVDVATKPGKGTTITIALPMTVTLLVIDGLIGRIGEVSYIIPLADVRESIRPNAQHITTVVGKGEMINVRGNLYPLIRTYKLLGITPEVTNPAEATIILAERNGHACGLMVDELIGQQSVVLKDLGKEFRKLRIIQGGAILGDGRVGLVFDVGGVLEPDINSHHG